jgi:hypothetical protein
MDGANLLKRVLWGANVLLGAGILVASLKGLQRAPQHSLLQDLVLDEDGPRNPVLPANDGDGALATLTNPLRKDDGEQPANGDPPFQATLKGTLPNDQEPDHGVAFIMSSTRNIELVAYVGEEIRQGGKIYEEFRGWTLASVSWDRAAFVNVAGIRVDLTIDLSIDGSDGGRTIDPRIGGDYRSDAYRSRLVATADTRQEWFLDRSEIQWAGQNAQRIFDRDFRVAPDGGGGLRLESVAPGSIGAARGLLPGDVIREVNGRPLNSLADVRELIRNPAPIPKTGLRLTIERAGKPLTIQYLPFPAAH